MPLLYALRSELGLDNPKFGCGKAQCGACTVHLDGAPVRSCVLPVEAAAGKRITTLSGLGTPEKPHPLQSAYIEEQVPQCGYCLSGWIMTAAAFLKTNPQAERCADPPGDGGHQVPLRNAHGDHARDQARLPDDGGLRRTPWTRSPAAIS